MPSVVVSEYRFVVDDASLSLRGESRADLEAAFNGLSDQIQLSRDRGEPVGIISAFDVLEFRPGLPVYELLTGDDLPRDCRVRAYGLLDKCGRVDQDPGFAISPDIEVDGVALESFALAIVADAYRNGEAVGAFALFPVGGPGQVTITDEVGINMGFVIVDDGTRCAFYRSIFGVENVPEGEFFALAVVAFPRLRFVDGLSFRSFSGSYRDLRDPVVLHLSALSDRFRAAFIEFKGMSEPIAAAVGVDLSIEGGTRQSERLMAMRDVIYGGERYRCEWHSKLEPHRNRIHFHPGNQGTEDCVLVGIFVEHLPT